MIGDIRMNIEKEQARNAFSSVSCGKK